MIQSNEMRIGNWINIPECAINAKVDIIGVKKVCIDNSNIDLNDDETSFLLESLNPIKLTEKILLKCGAKKSDDSFGGYIIYYPNGNGMRIKNNEWISQHISVKLEYLHQLQNLYFALTNQELTINL